MMTRASRSLLVSALFLLSASCSPGGKTDVGSFRLEGFPKYILWAWERPEDLEFLDPEVFGVAFLAQTLTLSNEDVLVQPRRQSLNVPPGTKLIAVTRIESRKHSGTRVTLGNDQKEKLIRHVARTLELPSVLGVQIDFDVVASEREFYRTLIADLRARLPQDVPLSITALASFCLGDRWMDGLQADEAVPMLFRMGEGGGAIRSHLENGGDLREPLCRMSYGISLDEPVDMKFDTSRRIYLFNPRAWKKSDLEGISERIRR